MRRADSCKTVCPKKNEITSTLFSLGLEYTLFVSKDEEEKKNIENNSLGDSSLSLDDEIVKVLNQNTLVEAGELFEKEKPRGFYNYLTTISREIKAN